MKKKKESKDGVAHTFTEDGRSLSDAHSMPKRHTRKCCKITPRYVIVPWRLSFFFFKTRIQNVDETTWTDEEDASSTIALIDQHMYKYANQTILLDGAAVCLALHHR